MREAEKNEISLCNPILLLVHYSLLGSFSCFCARTGNPRTKAGNVDEMQSGVLMLLLHWARGYHLNIYEGVVAISTFRMVSNMRVTIMPKDIQLARRIRGERA
ncbi:hypothetical protein MKW98_004163 [Papaver atlanticum]|uniref:Uncharacterized protein n=1 Tax=Papaver atlanticum TaxID=357466 RepID=A0AAD4XPB4_9MAGN|nr:hypothetical protein MKW98_004163 [Papaver atlanticum]